LSKLNGNEIFDYLKSKIKNKEALTDEDVMKLVILPLTQKNDKQEFIKKIVHLAKQIIDEDMQSFVLAGILAATDKFIDKNNSENIRRLLKMTKVGRLFEEEKIEYAQKYAQKREKETKYEIARNLLSKGVDILTIMESTMLTKAEILDLQNNP
jgi:DNA invertase Pin-like site-specific DNA recombinase